LEDFKAILEQFDKKSFAPPPLANVVFTGIFQDVAVSGKAVKSFVNACLLDSGDDLIDEVQSVTPESSHSSTGERDYRIDVEATTVSGAKIYIDVQLQSYLAMTRRSLLYAEQGLASRAHKGEKLPQVTKQMPRVLVVNILDFAIRKSEHDFHQVVELYYRKLPHERADDLLAIHHLELSEFRKIVTDYSNPLHCWLLALVRAQDQCIFVREVVEMDQNLKTYYDADPGFAQFVDRHGLVASDPKTKSEYKHWLINQIADDEHKYRHDLALLAEAKPGIIAERDMEYATEEFRNLKPGDDISKVIEKLSRLHVPKDIIESARKQVEAERSNS
jgi:predicted transposase/invertase (TIGR01784 family)